MQGDTRQQQQTAKIVTFIYGFTSPLILRTAVVDVVVFYLVLMEMRVYHNHISCAPSTYCV